MTTPDTTYKFDCFVCDSHIATNDQAELSTFLRGHVNCGKGDAR